MLGMKKTASLYAFDQFSSMNILERPPPLNINQPSPLTISQLSSTITHLRLLPMMNLPSVLLHAQKISVPVLASLRPSSMKPLEIGAT